MRIKRPDPLAQAAAVARVRRGAELGGFPPDRRASPVVEVEVVAEVVEVPEMAPMPEPVAEVAPEVVAEVVAEIVPEIVPVKVSSPAFDRFAKDHVKPKKARK